MPGAAVITVVPSIGEALRLSGTLFTSCAAHPAIPPGLRIVCRHRPPNRLAPSLGKSPVLLAAGIGRWKPARASAGADR